MNGHDVVKRIKKLAISDYSKKVIESLVDDFSSDINSQITKLDDKTTIAITDLEASTNKKINNLSESKQDKLVAGENIVTINGKSLLTSGNIDLVAKDIFIVVTELPESGVEDKVYLVKTADEEGNLYSEYIYENNSWEKLGDFRADIDLKDYITAAEIDAKYETKTDATNKQTTLQSNIDANTELINAITPIDTEFINNLS